MEKSNEELLTGITKLERQNPFPDEIFYRIFEIEDNVERQKYIEALRNEAKILKRSTEFNNLLKQFQLDYIQRMRQTGNGFYRSAVGTDLRGVECYRYGREDDPL